MTVRFTRALALTTALGAATFAGAFAVAQTAPPAPAPGASSPATPAPGASSQAAPSPNAPGYGMGRGGMGPGGMGRGDGDGWRGGEGRMGQGYGRGGEGYGRGDGRGPARQFSEQDRQAMFAAHLAGVRAGLLLTPEQDKLWPPVESAIREAMKQRQDWRARIEKEGPAANPVDRMRRMGEMASARGAAMTRIADAAAPLYNSLSDDQKRRLQMFHRMGGGMGMGMGMGMGGGGRGMMRGDDMRGEGMRGEGRGRGEGMRDGRHHDHHGGGYYRRGSYDERGDRRL